MSTFWEKGDLKHGEPRSYSIKQSRWNRDWSRPKRVRIQMSGKKKGATGSGSAKPVLEYYREQKSKNVHF